MWSAGRIRHVSAKAMRDWPVGAAWALVGGRQKRPPIPIQGSRPPPNLAHPATTGCKRECWACALPPWSDRHLVFLTASGPGPFARLFAPRDRSSASPVGGRLRLWPRLPWRPGPNFVGDLGAWPSPSREAPSNTAQPPLFAEIISNQRRPRRPPVFSNRARWATRPASAPTAQQPPTTPRRHSHASLRLGRRSSTDTPVTPDVQPRAGTVSVVFAIDPGWEAPSAGMGITWSISGISMDRAFPGLGSLMQITHGAHPGVV